MRQLIKKTIENLMLGPELGNEKLFLATVALLLSLGISGLIMGLALIEGCL